MTEGAKQFLGKIRLMTRPGVQNLVGDRDAARQRAFGAKTEPIVFFSHALKLPLINADNRR